ncbi:hypothetical protein SCHPADRAFT_935641 [Schizopora paradoxa]|uniref:Uncharacterized protein n=1 Tax=Schizopora paradoxa TaxID=27342 RepID=A0A0H2S469_9AGAM|nr:hypothetical protein SCHPADRAFT_935641 [Schizopora paradoxa]
MDDLYGNAWSSSDEPAHEEDLSDVKLPSSKPALASELETSWEPAGSLAATVLSRSESDGWKVDGDHAWNGTSAKPSLWSGDKGSTTTAVIPHSDVWGPAADEPPPSESPVVDDEELSDSQRDEAHPPTSPIVLPPQEYELEASPRAPSPDVVNIDVQEPIASTTVATFDDEFQWNSQENGAPPRVPSPEAVVQEVLASTTLDSFDDEFQWNSPSPAFENSRDDVWESAWSSSEPPEGSKSEAPVKDEWEVAKEQALRRERAVPREVMASIMEHLNGVSEAVWPPEKRGEEDSQKFGNWRDGIASVEGLSELVRTALPEVALQPLPPYPKTNTAKAVQNSIRLSRNLPIVRQSPLSHLFASKASTAWELSVKNKVDVQQDDIPAGWRMVEPEAKETRPVVAEKKSAGILSFWSRRTASTASTSSVSEAKPTQPPERVGSPSSKRSSQASVPPDRRSGEVKRVSQSGRATPEPSTNTVNALPSSELSNALTQSTTMPTMSPPATSTVDPPATPQAPSAVSRFWNRFSRTKSEIRSSSTSPRNSIALSTNELDFLSEIVPSAHDEEDEVDLLGSLSSAKVKPKDADVPPPPALAPPPLAPPARVNSVSSTAGLGLGISPPNPKLQPTVTPSSAMDDLSSLFGSISPPPSDNSTPMSDPIKPVTLPPRLPPPILPLSKPPSPSPLANAKPNHSRTSSRSESSPVISSPLRTASPAVFVQSAASNVSPIAVSSSRSISPAMQPSPAPVMRGLSSSPVKPLPMPPPTASFNAFDDDDEFSAFHSPSHPTPGPSQTSFHNAETSFSSFSDSSFLSHPDESSQDGDDSFGDFSDFISPPPSSKPIPSPPPPLPVPPRSPSPPKVPRKNSKANLHIRKPSAEERRALESLVEKAASQVGRWPAPLSPLPELLPKPPGAPSAMASHQTDFFTLSPGLPASPGLLMPVAQSNGASPSLTPPASVFGAMQATLPSAPSFPPPPSTFALSRPPSAAAKSATPPPIAQPQKNVAVGKSGLSAQDLSFFEGL